jgi:hypothetical protein
VRRDDGAVFMAEGSWHDANGAIVAEPPPLASAGVTTGGVVDPYGEPVPNAR